MDGGIIGIGISDVIEGLSTQRQQRMSINMKLDKIVSMFIDEWIKSEYIL